MLLFGLQTAYKSNIYDPCQFPELPTELASEVTLSTKCLKISFYTLSRKFSGPLKLSCNQLETFGGDDFVYIVIVFNNIW